ncbi:MAG: glycosyltransferase family 9 protein [Myxococcota bacterium]
MRGLRDRDVRAVSAEAELSDPLRVAVIRFGSVGDVVLTTPAIDALKRACPEAHLIYVTKAAMRPLIAHHGAVDELIYLQRDESPAKLASRIRELEPNAILDLHGNLRSRRVGTKLRGIRRIVWQKRPWQDNVPVRLGLRPYHAKMMISERYHRAVELLLERALPPGELRYVVGDVDRRESDAVLAETGLDRSQPLIGISPGAKWQTKQWPIERFSELANRCLEQGWQVVVTGSADEIHLAKSIQDRAYGVVSLAGRLSLGGLGGVIARCQTFVANDSGPMHIARALGVPTVAFFGTTDPRQFDFRGHSLLYAGVPCSPCHFYGRKRCPRGHFRCMLELDVDAAWAELVRCVSRRSSDPVRG